jgi:tetratricopeptide (TPR) repeat protein
MILLHYKRNQKAFECLSKALQFNPNYYPARILRAEANLRLKSYKDAFIDCLQALSLDVTDTALNLIIRIGKSAPQLKDSAIRAICAVVEDTTARDDLLNKLRSIENEEVFKSVGVSRQYNSDYNLRPVDRVAFAVSRNRRALIAIIESINLHYQ